MVQKVRSAMSQEQQVIQDTITRRTVQRADLLAEVKFLLATLVKSIPEIDEPLEIPREATTPTRSLDAFSDGPGTIPRRIATPPPPYRAPVSSGRQVGPKDYAPRIVYEVNEKATPATLSITSEPIYYFIKDHPKCNADQIQKKLKLRDGQLSGALHRLTVGGWIRTSPVKR